MAEVAQMEGSPSKVVEPMDTTVNGGKDEEEEELDPEALHKASALKNITDLITRIQTDMATKLHGKTKPKKDANKKKRRMTEKEEDDQMMASGTNEVDQEEVITHLTAQPSIIKFGTLRKYQLEGLNWMIRLYQCGVSGILADEMGLGKTLQSISILAYLKQFRNVHGPHLVCVPLSTLGNWMREFARWCPSIKTYKFHGNKEERKKMKLELLQEGSFEVILTSYEMANMEAGFLRKFQFEFIVVDEAHRLKNENSLLSKTLRSFNSKLRLLLTGTPLQNNLHELWALLNFLVPKYFGNAEEFDAYFTVTGGEGGGEDSSPILQSLHKVLSPFMLRRLKIDVETALKPKKETLVYVGMSAMQARVYSAVLKRDIDAVYGNCKEKTRLLNIVMQLRKAANHPYLFDGVEDRSLPPYGEHLIDNAGKVVVLDKLLVRLQKQDSRVLVFSQMTRNLDILEDYCVARGHNYCRIDGSTGTEMREEQMEVFNAPNSPKFIFLLSTRAGGLGINLATADIVILYDSDWNPQMDLQAMDRAHRIGQKKQVHVYRFVTQHTVEEKIIEKANIKLHLDAMVIQQGKLSRAQKTISKNDMVEMIRYGADRVLRLGSTGSITDEDIDAILAKGEQKTQEMREKMKKTVTGWDLTFDGSIPQLPSTTPPETHETRREFIEQISAAMPKREPRRKVSYNVDSYYREQISNIKSFKCLVERPTKLPKMSDFQFYNAALIGKLSHKETKFYNEHQNNPEPPAKHGLGEEERAEFKQLLADGFSEWNRTDFRHFVNQCEKFGRENIEAISSSVEGKAPEEVKRYYEAFWKNLTTISNHDKVLKRIEKGEARLHRTAKLSDILDYILRDTPDMGEGMESLELKYKALHRGKGYTTKEDRFLLYTTKRLGFGEWDKVRRAVAVEPEFTFDYFLKSRSAAELEKRVVQLIRIKEKDYERDVEGVPDATEPPRKRAKASSPSSPSPSSPSNPPTSPAATEA